MADSDFNILQGKTFTRLVRYEAPPVVWKPITAISKTAPVRITAPGHGLVNGWRAAVASVKGMTEINAQSDPPRKSDYRKATVVDANTIEFNDVNASDFRAYVSGGYLRYNTAVDLTGATARLSIKDKVGGTLLLSLTTQNGGIVINNDAKTIQIVISATATAGFTWRRGTYDLELVLGGKVVPLLGGAVTVIPEVTT